MADKDSSAPRTVPMGGRDPISDEELEKLAEITPEDIQSAKAAWRRHAPPSMKTLLDAPVEGEPEKM